MTGQIYSHLKFMMYPDRLQALREGRLAAPVHVRIKPINRCNHDCWYCAYREEGLQLGQNMVEQDVLPEEKMAEIVEDLIDMGVRAVTFSGGGEPLLYKRLPETIERLAAGGIRVAALTNGSALTGRIAEAFARRGTWLRISTESWDDESYAAARRIKVGEFTRVLNNMRAFAASGTRCGLGVSFIVTKENQEHILEACTLFKAAGAGHVSVSGVVVANEGRENNEYHQPWREAIRSQIALAKETLEDDSFKIINNYHEIAERFERSYTFCPFQQFQTIIGADAMVYSCHDKAYTELGALGSIRNRSFRDLWFSPELRERLWAIDPSRDCRHHCVAHKRNLLMTELLRLDPEHVGFV